MSVSGSAVGAEHGAKVPWGDVLLSAIVAVSWALIGMAGTAALGLHLLEADGAASLGPMTAAVVALGAGGSVSPSGDVSAFGLEGAEAATAIEITPLGVSLVGALLLSVIFLRSLRAAGAVIAPAELFARAGAVVALFTAMMGGLAWAGHDVVTIDGGALGLDDLPGGGGGGGVDVPGLGDLGDIGGLLPDRLGDLADAQAAVGFTVDTVPTLLGGLGWSAGILLIALLASRRSPLPRGWDAVHRVVRPAVSALVTVALLAVAAGLAAAAYAAIGDDHPQRIAGAALLGAPNGVWLGIPIGLFVPWDGRATGPLAGLLPDPLDDFLRADSGDSITLARLADLDSRVWLLAVAAGVLMLLAGVLLAVRTPVGVAPGSTGTTGSAGASGKPEQGALAFAGRCAVRLGIATALALPLLVWLTEVSVDASLSVLGFDAFDAGVELRGNLGMALLLGAAWGAGAGAAGALLARATGAAGRLAAPLALGAGAPGTAGADGRDGRGAPHFGQPSPSYPPSARTRALDRPYGSESGAAGPPGAPGAPGAPGRTEPLRPGTPYPPGSPYRPGSGYPPPNPDTNPYLRQPGGAPDRPGPGRGARPGSDSDSGSGSGSGDADSGGAEYGGRWPGQKQVPGDRQYPGPGQPPPPESPGHSTPESSGQEAHHSPGPDVYGAPTVAGPVLPPRSSPRRPRKPERRSSTEWTEGPPPPSPPPPPPPRRPRRPDRGE
ncbi:streptophobe family protein [Streptomyces sp. CRN 30]|uniref:streptophobe family protein n=1 Tax=Streptomyces sp. CRN 30 TaxID=3075613 RepID=UPI002A82C03A|nr:streptophobe family protein [Streptomyces sp. CRN 30]